MSSLLVNPDDDPHVDLTGYWAWVKAEADLIDADGCTLVSEWHQECCLEHDLGCHYGRDPRSAYRFFRGGSKSPWLQATCLTRRECDLRFANCNFGHSRSAAGMFRAIIRYLGVRIGAFFGIGHVLD